MSDGFHDDGRYGYSEPGGGSGFDYRQPALPSAPAAMQVDWGRFADSLSRLGTGRGVFRVGSGDGVFPRARLLQRDADYLAWDAMLSDCGIARAALQAPSRWRAHAAFMRCALRRLRSSWQARAVRFPLLRLPCLHVLGMRAPTALSELGRQLALAIADDERASLNAF